MKLAAFDPILETLATKNYVEEKTKNEYRFSEQDTGMMWLDSTPIYERTVLLGAM
jgi:hypothetical protein